MRFVLVVILGWAGCEETRPSLPQSIPVYVSPEGIRVECMPGETASVETLFDGSLLPRCK